MASSFSFSSEDTRCEGCHSEDSAHVSYRVEVRQKLCDGCAHVKADSIHAAEWFCQKHVMDKAKIFCLTHDVPICEACAITIHSKPCKLGEIGDTLKSRKEDLKRLIEKSKANEESISHQMMSVDAKLAQLDQHFAQEEDKLRLAYEEEKKKLKNTFEDRQKKLAQASTRVRGIAEDIRFQPEKKRNDLAEMRTRAETLLTSKHDLMKDFQQINSSLARLATTVHDPDSKNPIVEQIMDVARNVSFTKTGKHTIGTVQLPEEAWVPHGEYNPEIGKFSYMMGVIGGREIVIKDNEKHIIYVVNVESKTKKKVLKGNTPYDLWRCAPLKDSARRIVCGSNEGEIVICDRAWKEFNVIKIDCGPESSSVCVAVNEAGLILATAIGSSTIGVYNPDDDGKLVRSITVKTPLYDLCALPSGKMVVLNECVEGIDVSILNGDGAELASRHCHGEGIKSLVVDRGHDLIYMLCWDRHHSDYKVCVLSTLAEDVADRVATCEPSFYSPSCIIPRPDRMVIHTDGKILSFRKTKRGFHQLLAEIKHKDSLVDTVQNEAAAASKA